MRRLVALLPISAAILACSSPDPRFPVGEPIVLMSGTVHLGNNRANGQNFPGGPATSARLCSLVNLPKASRANLAIENLNNSESLANVATVNGRPYPLGITLEQDPRGVTPLSISTSPVFYLELPEGPSEICLTAGVRPTGDIDDFDAERVVLYVVDVSPDDVTLRSGLSLGAPPPTSPPGETWGTNAYPPKAPARR